jgi:hypothetical protein
MRYRDIETNLVVPHPTRLGFRHPEVLTRMYENETVNIEPNQPQSDPKPEVSSQHKLTPSAIKGLYDTP